MIAFSSNPSQQSKNLLLIYYISKISQFPLFYLQVILHKWWPSSAKISSRPTHLKVFPSEFFFKVFSLTFILSFSAELNGYMLSIVENTKKVGWCLLHISLKTELSTKFISRKDAKSIQKCSFIVKFITLTKRAISLSINFREWKATWDLVAIEG